jgi:hypothetical protein
MEKGEYSIQFEIIDPSGESILSPGPTRAAVARDGEYLNMSLGLANMELKSAGTYTWKIAIKSETEEVKTEFKFEIRENPDIFNKAGIQFHTDVKMKR